MAAVAGLSDAAAAATATNEEADVNDGAASLARGAGDGTSASRVARKKETKKAESAPPPLRTPIVALTLTAPRPKKLMAANKRKGKSLTVPPQLLSALERRLSCYLGVRPLIPWGWLDILSADLSFVLRKCVIG